MRHTRSYAAVVLIALVLPAPSLGLGDPLPLELPAGPRWDLHPPILVEGDAGFASMLSGVRGGTGTPEDPYVIARWTIAQVTNAAIRLVGTRAHVVIEDVETNGFPAAAHFYTECVDEGPRLECDGAHGIHLVDARNVTIRRVHMAGHEQGLFLQGSEDVRIEGADLGTGSGVRLNGGLTIEGSRGVVVEDLIVHGASIGLLVTGSSDVRIHRFTIGETYLGRWTVGTGAEIYNVERVVLKDGALGSESFNPFYLARAKDVLVENVTFAQADDVWIPFGHVQDVLVRDSRFARQSILVSGTSDNVRFVRNDFAGGSRASIDANGELPYGELGSVLVCGNDFHGHTGWGTIHLRAAASLRLAGNNFSGNTATVHVYRADGGLIDRNALQDGVMAATGSGLVLRENSFAPSTRVILSPWTGDPVDARENWWGDPSGPSGLGPGGGARLAKQVAADPLPLFEPWLTIPPDASMDCEALA